MYKLKYTKEFQKDLAALSKSEQKITARKLEILVQNPSYPSLRTKRLKGFDSVFESSINMDIRILWSFQNGEIILLLTIGHHKDVLGV